jgi:hypothetical protein
MAFVRHVEAANGKSLVPEPPVCKPASGEQAHCPRIHHERSRFPDSNPEAVSETFQRAGLAAVETAPIDTTTRSIDFNGCWRPFLGVKGQRQGLCSLWANPIGLDCENL